MSKKMQCDPRVHTQRLGVHINTIRLLGLARKREDPSRARPGDPHQPVQTHESSALEYLI